MLLVASLAWAMPAQAQQPPPVITIASNSPAPILVAGLPAEALPATVDPGTEVCIAKRELYVADGGRWVFQQWSHGPKTDCVTLTTPGRYRALYNEEFLLTVRSPVGNIGRAQWVLKGELVTLQAPETVSESNRGRYRFQQWSKGQTPFQTLNTTVILAATDVEAKWTKEYLLNVEGPSGVSVLGSGWYAEGASAVLLAPDIVPSATEGERSKFVRWETVGAPPLSVTNADKAITTVEVKAAYNVKAAYDKQFFVVATTPFGTLKREWMKDGAEIPLEALPLVETVPGKERFVFRRWDGQPGLISPKVTGTANGPVNLRAVYGREFMLTVTAPKGVEASGTGWYAENGIASISAPPSIPSKFLLKRTFAGFPGQSGAASPTTQVPVREPLTLTATYNTTVDLKVLGLLVAIPIELALIYFLWRRLFGSGRPPGLRRPGRGRGEAAPSS